MPKKGTALCLGVFLVSIAIAVWAQEESSNRVVSERLVVQIDLSSWTPESLESFKVSPDSRRVAYSAQVGAKWFVVLDGEEGKEYDGIDNPIFSPDSRRVAYEAFAGDKQFVVVDGEEGKEYDGIDNPIFSPDSRRVAYAAEVGDKQFVVVGGEEGKKYDGFVEGGAIIFDSPDSLHYLAVKGSEVYLVEEKIE